MAGPIKQCKVPCKTHKAHLPEKGLHVDVFATEAHPNFGYDLIMCTHCGEVYAVDRAIEQYVGPPMLERLYNFRCVNCNNTIGRNFCFYPEVFMHEGSLHAFNRHESALSKFQALDDGPITMREYPGLYD